MSGKNNRLILMGLAVLVIGGLLYFLPVKDTLTQFLAWIQTLGPKGAVLLGLAYIMACLFFLPGWILTLGAGFAFGVVLGSITVSIGSTLGAASAFLVGRTLARRMIEEKVASHAKFRAIDQAVGRQGFKIVLLTRLSPVFPFNLLNYAFGITKVSFKDYLFASWIGMLPGTVMYVYLGSAVKNLGELVAGNVQGGDGQKVLFGVGLAATIAVTVFITKIAQKAMRTAMVSG